ncbi:MAG: NAD-dependent epimerase/dehydratase family protein [Desulfobulbus oligotrophicus]|jgi:UDP-glucose 4-epimerase|nr:NAD-dependent epimerase/dehydratase family protein [Desulfobulbus oligotrophicus]
MKSSESHKNISTNTSSTCLVIGGRGFIGLHLIDALLQQDYHVRCFDRPHAVPLENKLRNNPNFEMFEGDFTNEKDIVDAFKGCDFCFHLVSTTLPQSSNADPVYDVESNVVATIKLFNHAVRTGLKKIIFPSSGGTVYGVPLNIPIHEDHPTNPLCSYGISKLTIEKYLELYRHLHGLEYSVLRISNPYGERQRVHSSQGVIAVFLGKILRGEVVEIWGDGSVTRDYIYIADVIEAMLATLAYSGDQRIFNIGSGQGHSLNEILDTIETVTGSPVHRRYLPGRPFDVPSNVLNIERARQYLDWSPGMSFEQGLSRFVKWLQQQPDDR